IAQSGSPCGISSFDECSADAVNETIDVVAVAGGEDASGGYKEPNRPVRVSDETTDYAYVPACDGNTFGGRNDLCEAATTTCSQATDVRFWVYRRTYQRDTPPPPYVRVLNPAFICLGPDDPQVDPTIAIPAIVDREFQRVVVLKGVAEVTPAPDTLVNVETRFATAAPASYEIPLTLLGQSVVITATAASWTWHFGDGETARLTDRSSTVHTYRQAGARGAYLVIEWTGTYRIGGDATVRQVNGTATTTGDPVQVAVRTARSELVDQPG
ncbi:MAG: hypothetical protein JWN08_2271, partial [Frankiales bacterium]|nr:hypothetical protein [Frankiales bacterium]